MPKLTGIIMSGDHPRLILEGFKTMTRRTAGLQKINENPDNWILDDTMFVHKGKTTACFLPKDRDPSKAVFVGCLYGQVGDRLWVRETWAYSFTNQWPDKIIYKADNTPLPSALERGTYFASAGFGRWAPSIHMFKKDARIWAEITEVRVERLRKASLTDAIAEGFRTVDELIKAVIRLNHLPDDADPWVWPISLRLLEATK